MTTAVPELPAAWPALTDEHTVVVPAGWPLVRGHRVGGPHGQNFNDVRFFGPLPTGGRFDHHPAGRAVDHRPDHGICYVALDDPAAVHAPVSPGAGSVAGNALDVVLCELAQGQAHIEVANGLTLSIFSATQDLCLLDLRSPWGQLTNAGTHLSTAPHRQVQPWARGIRDAYPGLHGILYVPATGGRAVAAALNESAQPLLSTVPEFSRPFDDAAFASVVAAIADRLGIALHLA